MTEEGIEFSGSSRRDSPPTVACNALLAAHPNGTTPAAGGPPQQHHTSSSELYPCSWRPTPTAPHQLIRILPLQVDVKAVSLCFVCAPCRQQRGDFCVEDQTSSHKAIIVVEVVAAEMSRSPFRSSCLIGTRQGAVTPRPTVSIPSRMTVLKEVMREAIRCPPFDGSKPVQVDAIKLGSFFQQQSPPPEKLPSAPATDGPKRSRA